MGEKLNLHFRPKKETSILNARNDHVLILKKSINKFWTEVANAGASIYIYNI